MKKLRHQRVIALIYWCWRRLLSFAWTPRDQPVSLEGCASENSNWPSPLAEGDSLESADLGGREEKRRREGWMASLTRRMY